MFAKYSPCTLALILALALPGTWPGASHAGHLWVELASPGQVRKAETLPDFAELAARLSPAVVNISTEPGEGGESAQPPEAGTDPFHEPPQPFERFSPHRTHSLGSGFIINREGFVLTNDHVVANSKEILVTTQDGREYKARLVGRDSKTDIALLRIDPGHPMPAAPLGDSDGLKVGEWVMAIGNPFGFDHSVTAGIVSAKSRFIPGNYDEFIQTDASINPGNSGGPLINLRGEVVAVNSAIYTRTGSNMGIGFAIPVNLVKEELEQLKENGKVVRGWLGVYIQRVTPEIAESIGLGTPRGALVSDVLNGGPAIDAGLKRGDVIVAYDNKPISDSQELPLVVGRTPVGRTVTLRIVRNKAVKEVAVKITPSREEEIEKASARAEQAPKARDVSELGLFVQNLTPKIAGEMGLNDKNGVVVSAVKPGSAADDAGLRKRDIILEINRQVIKDVESYARALKAGGKGRTVLLLVKREDNTLFVPLKPES